MTEKHSSITFELNHRRALIVDRIKATCGFEEANIQMNITYPSTKAFDNSLSDYYPEMVEKYKVYGAVTELPWKSHLD